MELWNFQTHLTRRLMVWSVLSIAAGIFLYFPNDFLRGVGIQFIAWGVIDLLIAMGGMLGTSRRKARLTPDELVNAAPKESAKLKRILLINTGLDVFYVAGGIALMLTLGKDDASWRGHGLGIIIQGSFLFFFDLFHALKLR